MKNIILDDSLELYDIKPIFVGEERCKSAHSFGPYIREHFIIHMVISGKGSLLDKYGEHKIEKDRLFIIRPGETTTYKADKNEPWHYLWIAFVGGRAKVFDTESSVYKCPAEISHKLSELILTNESSPDAYLSVIYDLIYRLFSKSEVEKDRLEQVKAYIDYNYMDSLTVEGIAREFGFERSYLYRTFKRRYGISVKEYIIKSRTEHATLFLESGKTVAETAGLVGYSDEFNFSRAFKKSAGKNPSEYKKRG